MTHTDKTHEPIENSAPNANSNYSNQELHSKFDDRGLVDFILADTPILRDKICAACKLETQSARDILLEVVRFLHLIVSSGKRLSPSRQVDLAWHELILCTKLYQTVCLQHFGRFVHHHPGGSNAENHAQFRLTIKLYNLRFGPADPKFWDVTGLYGIHAECGACEGSA